MESESKAREAGAIQSRWRPKAVLVSAGLLIPLLIFCAMALFDRNREEDRARDRVDVTTQALAEHAQTVMEAASLVLSRVLDHISGQDWTTLSTSRETHDFLASLKQELPQLESVFLVSPDGINVATSRLFPVPRIDVSSRAYFIHALHGGGLFVSEAFKGPLDRTFAFTITRPRYTGGKFDGLVGVTISTPYFEEFYKAVAATSGATAALVRVDGPLLIRFPDLPDRPTVLPQSSPLLRAIKSGADSGLYMGYSSLDGRYRLAGYRRLDRLPLVVNYTIAQSAYLRDWIYHLVLLAILFAALAAAVLLAGKAVLLDAERRQESMRLLLREKDRRQQAEHALLQSQKMEALGRVTGGVAHDFNNLLAAVLGSLELARKRVSDPRVSRLLDNAYTAAKRGSQLTARMLAYARRQDVVLKAVDVNATVRSMESLLGNAVGPLVTLRYELSNEVRSATTDPAQLESALLNLVVNARDATPEGGEVVISTTMMNVSSSRGSEIELAPGSYVRLSVRDTGQGMPEEVRLRAFEPFYTTKGPGKGTGLGLSMVFGLAAQSGGTATLESDVGKGTTVALFLPESIAAAPAQETAHPPQVMPNRPSVRVLLVDDDETVRAAAVEMLQELGHEVVQAGSGSAALALLAAEKSFDLLIIDFAMPDMNGSRLAMEMRKIRPNVPLLFVTGYVENDALRTWTDLGVPTLNKPFTQESLAAAIGLAIERGPRSASIIPLSA